MPIDFFLFKSVTIVDNLSQWFEKSEVSVQSFNQTADGNTGIWKKMVWISEVLK